MYGFGILTVVVQVLFAVHAIRRGHDWIWILMILLFPLVGCLIYFFVIVMPEMQSHTRQVSKVVKKAIDPHTDLKHRTDELEVADTVGNRIALAEEYMRAGRPQEAMAFYQKSLQGIFADDPQLLLGMGRACFESGLYAKARETLDHLIQKHPNFKSPDGHLLYARTLDALEDIPGATHEYEILATYYSGPEAKYRYALMLKRVGQADRANALFQDILKAAARAPRHYRKLHREWVDLAKSEVNATATQRGG